MKAYVWGKATWGGRAAGVLLVLGTAVGSASAQSVDPGRAFRGLFVPNLAGTTAVLATDVYQGSNHGSSAAGFGGGSIYDHGTFAGVSSNLAVTHTGRRTTIGATGFGSVRYFTDTGDLRSLFHGGAFGLRHEKRRVAFQMQQDLTQQPIYGFGNLRSLVGRDLGSLGSVSSEYGVIDGYSMLTAASSFGLALQNGRRQWLSGGYRYAHTTILRRDETLPELPVTSITSQDLSARTSHQFWKNTGVHFDFIASRGGLQRLRLGAPTWIYTFDASVDRLQNINLTRSTAITLTGGTSMLNDAVGRRYVFVGSGSLSQRMGRRSRLAFGFRRDLHFIEGLEDPVLTNALILDLDTRLNRRMQFTARGTASRGRAALAGDRLAGIPYTSYGLEARLRARVRGPFGAYAEYVTVQQDYDDPAHVLSGRPVDRYGIRAGLVISLPLSGQRGVE
jgi:hypothetical protein